MFETDLANMGKLIAVTLVILFYHGSNRGFFQAVISWNPTLRMFWSELRVSVHFYSNANKSRSEIERFFLVERSPYDPVLYRGMPRDFSRGVAVLVRANVIGSILGPKP